MKWKQITKNTSCIFLGDCLITVYQISPTEIILFDTGSRYAPALLSEFQKRGLSVKAIVNTHLHKDHTANNRLLMEAFDCKAYATEIEIRTSRDKDAMTQEWGLGHPDILEEVYQFYQYPFEIIPYMDGVLEIAGVKFETVTLPGHSLGHIGFVTPDQVFIIGDTILSTLLVKIAKMPFSRSWKTNLQTLEKLRQTSYPYYILAHREVITSDQLVPLIDANIQLENRILNDIVDLYHKCDPKLTDTEFVAHISESFGLRIRQPIDQALFANAIQRKLDYLAEKGDYIHVSDS